MKEAFSRFLGADPDRLHFAAHSHHPWPDVTLAAHQQAWEDAARWMDDKWDHVFGTLIPRARRRVAAILGLPDPGTIVFGTNTHEFVGRIASNLPRPFRVLTTDSEFHSFTRQLSRWEEAGEVIVTRVAAEPFATFPARLADAYSGQDLVYFSQVHFNSGYVVDDLAALVTAFGTEATIVVDGYHAFLAVPTDLSAVAERAFYVAGGYKYAMAGEGACFLHVPAGAPSRPVNTGWYAGFDALTSAPEGVVYADGGQRFAGATADPSGIYRLDAVLGWLEEAGTTVADIRRHVGRMQDRLLERLSPALAATLIPPAGDQRGSFLTFVRPDAAELYRRLHADGVITDHRGNRWRIGVGLYHDEEDIDRLAAALDRALAV